MITHNLPQQPYKKFFGREESIKKIEDILLGGATFIASIDGVGGIGKTALAYHFCKNIILQSELFKNVIWISAKETIFDPFSIDKRIKIINNKFNGINTLIDVTLKTIGFGEYIQSPFDLKKSLFEDFVKSESVLIVLDNLENVDDEEFFKYIKYDFNKFALENNKLKVLTTSRKRKRLIDNPIEIEGLEIEDALAMLKYLAKEYNVKDVLKASDHDNIILVEKVGKIPLGIEFIIGQMAKGKNRGEIYQELNGYPSIDEAKSERERKKVLSDIILFSFQNMYESLNEKEKKIFQIIAAFQKNKTANDPDISIELLLSMTNNMSKYDIEEALDTLIENKLIIRINENSYGISPMSINFVKQYYDNFEEIEEEVVGKKRMLLRGVNNYKDKVDILINDIRILIDENKYEEAERKLLKALDITQDYRIYYELAGVQRVLNKFRKASDNYRMAANLNPKYTKIWYDWINMEDNRGRHNFALDIIDKALLNTNNDVSIVLQRVNILKFMNKFNELRNVIMENLEFYKKEGRKEDYLRLLRNWKNIEYKLLSDGKDNQYFKAVNILIKSESDKEIKINLLKEQLRIARKTKNYKLIKSVSKDINRLKNSIIQSMSGSIKKLNTLFNAKHYSKAKKEARKILVQIYDHLNDNKFNTEYAKNALRILLQILASEHDYERIILTFEDYEQIGYMDENCISIYKKARKEKENLEKRKKIEKILFNIQEIEVNIREIVMWALDYDENSLISLVEGKGKKEWIDQWMQIKNKSLKSDANLIHYSDLSHLRSILSWTKSFIIKKIDTNIYEVKNDLNRLTEYLENYVSKERNDAFHSRLQLLDDDELEYFIVDTKRLLEIVLKLRSLCDV